MSDLPANVRVTVLESEGRLPEYLITAGDGTQPTFIYLRLSALDTSLLALHLAQLLAEHDGSRAVLTAASEAQARAVLAQARETLTEETP